MISAELTFKIYLFPFYMNSITFFCTANNTSESFKSICLTFPFNVELSTSLAVFGFDDL